MPIIELVDNQLVQQCAMCSATRRLDADGLPTEYGARILALPACTCGAVESLIHSPQDEPPYPQPGSVGHQHRVLVDAVIDAVAETKTDQQPLAARALAKVPDDVKAMFREPLKPPATSRVDASRARGGQ